jgi:hypothetical protein
MNKKIEYGLGVALSILLPLAIFFLILNLQTKCNPEQTSNKISPPMDISNTIYKNDNERFIIIKIKDTKKTQELKLDTEYLRLIFDNLIDLIERFIKKLISENNKKLDKEEINNLLPKFISSSVENIIRILVLSILEELDVKDINELKTKLIYLLQDNMLTNYVLKLDDINSSTKIINNLNSNNFSIEDVKNFIPKILGDIVYDMSKSIISNIITFDENGNIIKSTNLYNIKKEFINVLNKYLPYKSVYFEISNNGSSNMPGITLKLEQLKDNPKIEQVVPFEYNMIKKSNNRDNLYQEITNLEEDNINKSFNIQDMNPMMMNFIKQKSMS